jgi:hypothetical protein
MNTNQQNKLDMLLAMQAICNTNMAELTLLPQFEQWFDELGNIVKNIKKLSEAQELDYKGKTETKATLKSALADKTMDVVRRVVAYANVNDLYELKQEVDYTESDLMKAADTNLRTICQVVKDRALSVLPELATYGVTQAMLDELQTAIEDFFAEISSPREGIISRKNATSALKEEFKKADEILYTKLDKLVGILKTGNPEVYNSYVNARIIIDLGRGKSNGHYSIKGKVADFESGLPLGGVNVSIVGTTQVMMTGIDGVFDLAVKEPGVYQVRGEKEDYVVVVEEAIVGEGQEELVLEMEKVTVEV